MLHKWFHGILGKLAGIGYAAGVVCLVLALALSALPTAAGPSPSGLAQDVGNCLRAGSGQVRDKHDDGGTHTFTAPAGWIYVEAGFKAGDGCFTTTSDGNITVDDQACYSVSGLGTGSVTITQLESSRTCKDISHTEALREQEPANTPVPPTNTPINTPTNTPEGDPTNTPTPTNRPTRTPSNTPTDTATPTATNTLAPGETPSITPTPSDTPEPSATATETPGPPLLIDPKEDGLLTDNDGNGLPSPGDVLQYTITITNDGETAAEGVTFSDTPDANTSLVVGSVTTTNGTVTSGNSAGDTTVGVAIGTIAVNETVTITFEVTIDAGLPPTVGEVENQGLISGDNVPTSDTDDPDTDDPDDPTVTLLVHPTPTPTSTSQDPGDPTPEPTDPPPSDGTATVLIPVTGVDRTVVHTHFDLQGWLQNLGLSLLGLSLILHGAALYRRRSD